MIDEGSAAVLASSGVALQEVHRLLESARIESEVDSADSEGTRSGGGVGNLGGGGDVKYDFLRKSHKEIKSDVPSITPFNLIPYLINSR